MPRLSLEAKSARVWQTQASLPKPPRHLDRLAKGIWNEIVESRPVDFFQPGSLHLLEQLCVTIVSSRIAQKELQEKPTDHDCIKAHKDLCLTTIQLATKLRLTIQTEVDRKSGKLAERPTTVQPWKSAA